MTKSASIDKFYLKNEFSIQKKLIVSIITAFADYDDIKALKKSTKQTAKKWMIKMAKKKSKSSNSNTIALNKKARHNYSLTDKFEGGMSLQGWEIKSIRSGKVNISDCYVHIKDNEAYLLGAEIMPLNAASSHVVCDPNRDRKLLLNRRELDKLSAAVDRDGYSLIATAMYWKQCWVKLEFYLGKGKKDHDKRSAIKDREWAVDKGRLMKNKNLDR